jgi:hypothetical protein
VRQLTRPLFRFDPGWLFILAGLVTCAAGVLLPAQTDLDSLQRQLEQLRAQELLAYDRLKAHARFLDQVDRSDPAIVKRLAAAQLNLVPSGDKPLVVARSDASQLTDWIESTLDKDLRPPKLQTVSTLSRWANGPYRLWLFGGGIMSVFVGLMLSPAPTRIRQQCLAPPVASVIEPKITIEHVRVIPPIACDDASPMARNLPPVTTQLADDVSMASSNSVVAPAELQPATMSSAPPPGEAIDSPAVEAASAIAEAPPGDEGDAIDESVTLDDSVSAMSEDGASARASADEQIGDVPKGEKDAPVAPSIQPQARSDAGVI